MKTGRRRFTVTIGLGSCGVAAGAEGVAEAFRAEARGRGLAVAVKGTGCIGICHREVLAEVSAEGGRPVLYGDLTPARVRRIAEEHLAGGVPVGEWLLAGEGEDISSLPYFAKQRRIVLGKCGLIDPEEIGDYIGRGGYAALSSVLDGASPDDVIRAVTESGLRGRGGAGFPTGRKWRIARDAPGGRST